MKKRFFSLAAVLITAAVLSCGAVGAQASAELPFEAYAYNGDSEPVSIPAPYTVEKVVNGGELGLSGFSDIGEVFYDGGERLYFCDSGNNRIVITDTSLLLVRVLDGFDNGGTGDFFSAPTGIYVSDGSIYIADSGNSRIVVLSAEDYSLEKILPRPEITLLGEDYKYTPTALAADSAGRIYVIADGVNQGLICLDEDGAFSTFLGAPEVVPDLAESLWRRFATEEQLEQMQQYVPTEYSALLIDGDGFIYAVSQSSEARPVVKLNSDGDNVLPGYDEETGAGDLAYTEKLGSETPPYFTDIALDENGTYYILDSQKGRIYVYAQDGSMLYAFGAGGSQKGTFSSAASIETVGDMLLVTDRIKESITVFRRTRFGERINEALSFYERGDYGQAAEAWSDVYNRASGYTPAVVGLAKIDLQNGDYSAAMEKLRPIHEQELYSKAFEKQRDIIIRAWFYRILAAAALAAAAVVLLKGPAAKSRLLKRASGSNLARELKYGTYVMFHPFDGFWDIKHEKRGSLKAATVIFAAFILMYAVRVQFSGYAVTGTVSSEVNALYSCALIVFPIIFWIISNWCFTALMDGEGSMRDIYISVCYALKPYVLFSIPMFILSHILTGGEAVFYNLLDAVSIIWVIALIFFGMMMTHNYTLSKSILTAALTLLGICLIIFILLLFVNIIQEVFTFGYNIYKELILRTY